MMILYNDLVELPKDNNNVYKDVKKRIHNNTIFTFDIETTSGWLDDNGNVVVWNENLDLITNKKGKRGYWFINHMPVALCYIWQCAIEGKVYYGRELESFYSLLERIDNEYVGIKYIYVHNLQFEFAFLLNILSFDNVFARKKHKPMKATTNDFNIEFRCSYFLTRLSLDSWGKQIGYEKATGTVDYNVLRTPITPLDETLLNYAERDVLVMYKGLVKYRKKYGSVYKIPLTQTGEVRRVVKELYKNDYNHLYRCTKNLPSNYEEYMELVERFGGGETHANYAYAGDVIEDVTSMDIESSYPWIMCTKAFPDGKWYDYDYIINDENHCYMLEVELYDIESNYFCNFLSVSKCTDYDNVTKDNGRIMTADYVRIKCLDVDFEIIKKAYSIKKIKIVSCKRCNKRYLPIKFVEYVLQLYNEKTKLKGKEGFEDLYLQAKQFVNSLFGMMVTALVAEEILFNGEWDSNKLTKEFINKKLNELKEKVYKNFNQYDWGIYVTAYARERLWEVIFELDKYVCYYDTDSVKFVGKHDNIFTILNDEVHETAKKIAERRDINLNLFKPLDYKGKQHHLGEWCFDGFYTEFKTLGAKRYAYRDKEDGELHLTVSGVNKTKGVIALNNDLNNFKENMIFSAETSGKALLTFLTNMPIVRYPDGYISKYQYGYNVRNSSYKLKLSDDYSDLISDEDLYLMYLDDERVGDLVD